MEKCSRSPEYDKIQEELKMVASELFEKYAPEDAFMIAEYLNAMIADDYNSAIQ